MNTFESHAGLNADLHCHSVVSDGTLSPEELAKRAKTNGVALWALTDHDEVGGQVRAQQAAREWGLPYLTGVEISVTFGQETVHIVGLGIDLQNADLLAGLAHTRTGREWRAREMAAQLAQAGIANAYEGALQYAGNPHLISRTHFARYLIEIGACTDMAQVFRRYLTEGKPGYVAHRWASLSEAVRWITQAGGMAVMAHPGRYRFTREQEHALFGAFKSQGGGGVEVVTGSHSASDFLKYAQMARLFGLAASRGSDFHSPEESRTDLGQLPPLPTALTPVWELLADRVMV